MIIIIYTLTHHCCSIFTPDQVIYHRYTSRALPEAAEGNNIKEVSRLLGDGCNVNSVDSYDWTALHRAAVKGYTGIARLLLAREDCDVNPTNQNGNTPLHYAAYNGHTEVARLLLAREDCDVTLVNKNGDTPLKVAVERYHLEVAVVLLERVEVRWDYIKLYCACVGRGWYISFKNNSNLQVNRFVLKLT